MPSTPAVIENSAKFRRGDRHPFLDGMFYLFKQHGRHVWVDFDKLTEFRATNSEWQRKWALAHRDKRNAKHRSWRHRNPQKRKAIRDRWREKNLQKFSGYQKKYIKKKRASCELYRLIGNMRCRVRAAFVSLGVKKTGRTMDHIGCTAKFLKSYLESLFQPGMTWERKSEIHIDHKIPLASAKTKEDLLKLFHYTNLQPLWAEENRSKNNRIIY